MRSGAYTADILAAVVWMDSAPCCGIYSAMFKAFKSLSKLFCASGVQPISIIQFKTILGVLVLCMLMFALDFGAGLAYTLIRLMRCIVWLISDDVNSYVVVFCRPADAMPIIYSGASFRRLQAFEPFRFFWHRFQYFPAVLWMRSAG